MKIADATSSLPVPLSPTINTVDALGAIFAIIACRAVTCGLTPIRFVCFWTCSC